ncbi:hypothetical protein CYMTET_13472 [Cymbomonas tetramitiformis]|uniref:Uncharacterized protein n=1 Tax=Cymbomonas tetramitiformis TaxID=36881 RepID=A0AAE0GJK0_9CHLO|nr:hypothetical protein CYMTET_13471 [Cymbomonas tetramitiformis]KAK3278601.1 hypothetical protein CYMTET_13472 [Cymbomonas tetramitiformis]
MAGTSLSAELLRRRVKTPGIVFGERVAHKVYYGTIVKAAKARGDPPEPTFVVKHDDGQRCWYPASTLKRWVLPIGDASVAEESESDEASDAEDSQESEAGVDSDDEAVSAGPGTVSRTPQKETPAEKVVRLQFEAKKVEVAATIGSAFKENSRVPEPNIEFVHGKSTDLFFPPPNDHTPGLLKSLVKDKPRTVEAGMSYVFDKILPDSYWRKVSKFSRAYAVKKGAGTDINAAKVPEDRHKRYGGKGKQRPFNPEWGGEGLTVHYINPKKPNKRMSMCFMFAAYGIPLAWEFYTGRRSNTYNEEKHNTKEEVAYGKTISRVLRLFRQAYGKKSKGNELFFDNLFTSIFLFHLLRTLYDAVAVGTHVYECVTP